EERLVGRHGRRTEARDGGRVAEVTGVVANPFAGGGKQQTHELGARLGEITRLEGGERADGCPVADLAEPEQATEGGDREAGHGADGGAFEPVTGGGEAGGDREVHGGARRA